MVHGAGRVPSVDEADLETFVGNLSSLPTEEWQKRIAALKRLVDCIPDYSATTTNVDGECGPPAIAAPMTPGRDGDTTDNQTIVPWYRSSTSVRRLAPPLKCLILDARSAVVKDATELVRTLMMVKLQPHPSLTIMTNDGADGEEEDGEDYIGLVNDEDIDQGSNGALETINGSAANCNRNKIQRQLPPPPAFVGRLLLRDLLPFVLDLSKQTVKVIRMYGVNMTIDILPHCRVKSCVVMLLERMKTHQNRTVREDCARYLRCILETWPWDPSGNSGFDTRISNDGIVIAKSRKDERLSLETAREIGLGLGRSLSDSTHPVREEAKNGFQVLFRRFRPVWNEVMRSGIVRDVRLRKKLMEMAASSRSDGNLFDDEVSLGQMSLNSAVSGLSHASNRSYMSHTTASRGMASNGVPSVIGTPTSSSPRAKSRVGNSSSSPSYMRITGSSSSKVIEQGKMLAKEAPDKYSINKYVTSTGHVLSTPSPSDSPRRKFSKPASYGAKDNSTTAEQPFASLMHTPSRPTTATKITAEILRKRLSRRISGIKPELHEHVQSPSNQLSCIDETEDCEDAHTTEVTAVALEVILAHLSHIEQLEKFIATEKGLLQNLNKQVGIEITDMTKTSDIKGRLCDLTEEQVCDYFDSVHTCVNKQRNACEDVLREMERISQGTVSTASISESPSSDIAQSPLGKPGPSLQRNLKDEFGANM